MESEKKIEDIYPLSPMQKGMLFHTGYEKDETYFEQSLITIQGDVNLKKLEQRLQKVVRKYAVLRTVFESEFGEEPLQVVLEDRCPVIDYEDLLWLDETERENYVREFMRKDRQEGFCLDKDLLIRMKVFHIKQDIWNIVLSFHHIVLDGWSWGIILQELLTDSLYESTPALKEKVPYVEYIKWLERQSSEEAKEFWKQYFSECEETGKLAAQKLYSGSIDRREHFVSASKEQMQKLQDIARQNRVTVGTLLQTIWGYLLSRYTASEEIIFGNVTSGRDCDITGIEEMVGVFIHTIPIRLSFPKDERLMAIARRHQQNIADLQKYSFLPLNEILSAAGLSSDVFDTIIAIENYPFRPDQVIQSGDCKLLDIETFEQTNYDLTFVVIPGEELNLRFIYNGNRYEEAMILNIGNCFLKIIDELFKNQEASCSDIEYISEACKDIILRQFNHKPKAVHTTIANRFRKMVLQHSGKTALCYRDQKMLYGELDRRSNQVANTLVQNGVARGDVVGILVAHNIETIIGILGIIKAGGAYLPIDKQHPQQRVEQMLADGRPKQILNACEIDPPSYIQHVISLFKPETLSGNTEEPVINASSSDLAYIMYSSGTTGKPKGVAIEQKGILRLVLQANYMDFREVSVILQTSSLLFDAATLEIWGTLLNGLTLVITEKETILETYKLGRYIRDYAVDCMWLTSSLFNQIASENEEIFETIKVLLVGGDVVSPANVAKVQKRNAEIKIVNGYGPTENTTFSTCYPIERRHYDSIPIGKAINGTTVYILDRDRHLVPIGAVGELYVGGEGLAREYINAPELTQDKFCINPYVADERLYKTGDRARWLGDGNIEFLGRIDHQVKIRGFRIELSEIESVLHSMSMVHDAVVIVNKDDLGNKNICAYLVIDKEANIKDIKHQMKKSLPEYMIPARYVILDKIPLTANGKFDRNALPETECTVEGTENYIAPTGELEEILTQIWQQVLAVEKVGVKDDFFELGGDSIKAIQVVAKARKYSLILEVKDIFDCTTILDLKERVREEHQKIQQGIVEGEVNLTPIQKWLLDGRENVNHFNQAVTLKHQGIIDGVKFKEALFSVVKHHDALRMQYSRTADGVWSQTIRGITENIVECEERKCPLDYWEKFIDEQSQKMQESMNIEEGPLVKAILFYSQQETYVLLVIHHLVVDGVSWRILLEDLETAYSAALAGKSISLPNKTNSFKDWSEALTRYAQEKMDEGDKRYWRDVEEELNEVPIIRKDFNVNCRKHEDTSELEGELTEQLTETLLTTAHRRFGTRINDLLLSALALSFREWSGQNLMSINLEGHGREDILSNVDISRTVGWFTSVYPIVVSLDKNADYGETIKQIKEYLRKIPHNGVGYGIMKYLTADGMFMENMPEISFNYLGQFVDSAEGDFQKVTIPSGSCVGNEFIRPYAIDMNCKVENGRFKMYMAFNRKEYKESTIQIFLQTYISCLQEILKTCTEEAPKEYTPSDFDNENLQIEELDDLLLALELM